MSVLAATLLAVGPRDAHAELLPGQRQRIVLSDAAALENFGSAVAIDADTAVVGTPYDDTSGGVNAGAAYVFVRDAAGAWEQRQRLTGSNSATDNHFGETVAISGRHLLVGAADRNSAAGTVYAFRRSTEDTSGVWSEEAQLAPAGLAPSDAFGSALSLSSTTALIAAAGDTDNQGAAYVFVRTGGNPAWTQQGGKLVAPQRVSEAAFGFSVAVDGDVALIGAPGHTDAGAVFAFRRLGTSWGAGQALAIPAAFPALASGDAFGSTVAVSGSWGLIGAPGADVNGVFEAGSAFFFELVANAWVARQRLDSPQPADSGGFGSALDVSGTRAVVGASLENGELGQVHLFGLQGSAWSRSSATIRPIGGELAGFGSAVAIGSSAAVVGAPQASCVAGADCGAVYLVPVSDAALPVPVLGAGGRGLLAALMCGAVLAASMWRRRRACAATCGK